MKDKINEAIQLNGVSNTIDFDSIFKEEMATYINEKLRPAMAAKVEKMMDGVMNEVFKSWGDVADQVKAAIQGGLQISIDRLELKEYNALIAHNIQHEVNKGLSESVTKNISDIVRQLIGAPGKEKISAYDFINLFVTAHMEDNHEYSGRFTFHHEHDEHYGWHELWIDKEEDTDRRSCAVRMLVSGDSGRIFSVSFNDYHAKGDPSNTPPKSLGVFQSIVMRLYNGGTKLDDLGDLYDFDEGGNYEWERD